MSTDIIIEQSKIVFIGQYENIGNLFASGWSECSELDLPLTYLQKQKVDLIIIPYHAKIRFGEEVLGVWEILMKIRVLESETGEKGESAQSHICILGNLSLDTVLRHEERAILLASQGVSYLRLPVKLDLDSIKEKIKDRSTPDNTRCYIAKLVDIRSLRHAYANIWGLDRLIQVHKKYSSHYKSPIDDDVNYPEKYKKLRSSLEYNIAKYVFKQKIVHGTEMGETRECLEELRKVLKNQQADGLRVLIIDDQADAGWGHLIKSMLGDITNLDFVTLELKNYTRDNLFYKFESLYNNNTIDVVISDLRLYPEEEQMSDYSKLKSIALFQAICDKENSNGKKKYQNTRYMFMTASNQLNNYKEAVGSDLADAIFIKEGFDYLINNYQFEANYRNFVNSLCRVVKAHFRLAAYDIRGISNPDTEFRKIKEYDDYFSSGKFKNRHKQISDIFNQYTHVILDTNVYYSDQKPYIAFCDSDKIKCHYPVFKEIERLNGIRELSFRKKMADYFYNKNVNSNLLCDGLSSYDINKIDEDFSNKTNLKNLADGYFKQTIECLSKQPGNRILFITNDTWPYEQVKVWKSANQITNVTIKKIWDYVSRKAVNCEESNEGRSFKVYFDDESNVSIERQMVSVACRNIAMLRSKIMYKKYLGDDCQVMCEILRKTYC